ncbi:phage portal protein [Sporanaerobacter sp. PP17-6a]|uniref:phage portal protein n=1 Tax=Sporanaerobacter sp. PP17-6a TaxID=1891289 RepID=UPI0008A03F91|nr:phage portal protein [Sporanaerobacter sp. PP17-6a]SCL88002.1 phage portal protein, HK97 family [Sporanaerobacter sp. PP17-6a]
MKVVDFLRDFFGDKKTVYITQKLESERYKLAIEDFSIQMAINMIAGAIGKCEFKTYLKGQETKADEYYLWNVEPNVNQNSSQFMQELISRLLFFNEVLVVEVNNQLIIAENFTQNEYALYPNTFTGVTRGDLTFDMPFSMPDVLYFRLNNKDIRALLSNLIKGYSEILNMAIGKYKRAGGRKATASVKKTKSGDKDYEQRIEDFFNKRMKNYFESENAVVVIPNGVEYSEITGEANKKTTSEINDITNITKEVMFRVAQAFRIPPALLQGDVADVSKVVDEWLTFGIDPLVDLIQTEINRKRYGKTAYLSGSYLKIDTTAIKHIDIFSIANQADKLISDGLYSVDELRIKLGDTPLSTWWSKEHWMTKNYQKVEYMGKTEGGEGSA